jgi:hypothetical protein
MHIAVAGGTFRRAGVAQLFRVSTASGGTQGNFSDLCFSTSMKIAGSRNVTVLARQGVLPQR